MTINDKRRHFRKSLQAQAAVADILGNTWTKIDMLDISGNGAAFISAEEYLPGAARMLRFQLPENAKRISAACKIVHCVAHPYLRGYRVGVEFVRIDEQDLVAVNAFVSATTD